MKFQRTISRPLLFCAGFAGVIGSAMLQAADGTMPAPSQVFTPRAAAAFYIDVESASKSAIWTAITNKAAPLVAQLQSLQPAQLSSLQSAQLLPGLKGMAVAEIAAVFEGEKILSDLQSERLDPASGFVLVGRLTGSQDLNGLIQQALDALDKEKPGVRGQIEKSRHQVGGAEFFDVPPEILGEEKLPFNVSVAIGPGKEGVVFGVGRSENLQAFVTGKTEGKLRGQINEKLSRRGQMWFYLPVPKDATKSLGGGSAGGMNGNPMISGLAQGMNKVSEIALSLNFAASQIDFALDLVCSDGPAANELNQGIQGLLGMVQMGAKQNPSSMAPFVGRIKAGVEGNTFRLGTAFTMRDFDLAFQNINRGVMATGSRVAPKPPKSEAAAPVVQSTSPVDVEFIGFSSDEQESLRTARIRIHNRSSKPVREIRMTFTYLDAPGRKLGQWTRSHSSLTGENLINGDATAVVDCLAFNVPAFTKKITETVHEVIFADGEKWSEAP